MRVPRLIHSAPAPFGPLNLCADSDSRSTPSARTFTGILADRLHGIGVKQRAAAVGDARQLGHRLDRAELVVGVHHRHEGGVVGERLFQRLAARRFPVGPTGSSVVFQPRRASAFRVTSTASCSMARRDEVFAAGRLEGLGRSTQRKIVGLGSAAGEDKF